MNIIRLYTIEQLSRPTLNEGTFTLYMNTNTNGKYPSYVILVWMFTYTRIRTGIRLSRSHDGYDVKHVSPHFIFITERFYVQPMPLYNHVCPHHR